MPSNESWFKPQTQAIWNYFNINRETFVIVILLPQGCHKNAGSAYIWSKVNFLCMKTYKMWAELKYYSEKHIFKSGEDN